MSTNLKTNLLTKMSDTSVKLRRLIGDINRRDFVIGAVAGVAIVMVVDYLDYLHTLHSVEDILMEKKEECENGFCNEQCTCKNHG